MINHPSKNALKKIPAATWPLWQQIGLSLFLFGSMTAIMAFLPPPPSSPIYGLFALVLAIIGITSAVVSMRTGKLWARFIGSEVWSLCLLGLGIRWFGYWAGDALVVALISVPIFLLSILLPVVLPKVSSPLWREQIAPQNRFGRGCLLIAMRVLPIASGGGALVGLYGHRAGYGDILVPLVGIGAIMVAFIFGQVISHQLWQERLEIMEQG